MKRQGLFSPHRPGLSLTFVLFASVLLFSPNVAAQDLDEVTIAGRVMDQNGALIPHATVTAMLQTTNETRTVQAGDDGRFRIIELEPGAYTVRASSSGFATEEKKDLVAVAGQNVQLDFTLKL